MLRKKIVKKIITFVIFAVLLSIGLCFIFPDIANLKKENPEKTAFMKYREKEWQQKGKKISIRQAWRHLSAISPYLIKAVLIAEDDKFYQHEGFDFEAVQKAVEKDIKQKKFKFGGSTISQQLAQNLYLSPSKNPARASAYVEKRSKIIYSIMIKRGIVTEEFDSTN